MIQLKPHIEYEGNCPYCGIGLTPQRILWQGIHVCAVSSCDGCKAEIIEDLRIGHAIFNTYQVNVSAREIFGPTRPMPWFGKPLLESLCSPSKNTSIELRVQKKWNRRKIVIINCIDHLYGHALLKLLNAERYKGHSELGIVIIAQHNLEWMIPDYVAEIWSVEIPLREAQNYFPTLHWAIEKQLSRFESVHIDRAYSHPKYFDIANFTGVDRHSFTSTDFRITFVWREDRLWLGDGQEDFFWRARTLISKTLQIFGYKSTLLAEQNATIVRLFSKLKKMVPHATFTVTGLGTSTCFPSWIEDARVDRFTSERERSACQIYSESRLIIGVHGSNMLLPSGLCGMTLDLMPIDRWGNIAQDVLYRQMPGMNEDSRMVAWRNRYIPISSGAHTVAAICDSMINDLDRASRLFLNTL